MAQNQKESLEERLQRLRGESVGKIEFKTPAEEQLYSRLTNLRGSQPDTSIEELQKQSDVTFESEFARKHPTLDKIPLLGKILGGMSNLIETPFGQAFESGPEMVKDIGRQITTPIEQELTPGLTEIDPVAGGLERAGKSIGRVGRVTRDVAGLAFLPFNIGVGALDTVMGEAQRHIGIEEPFQISETMYQAGNIITNLTKIMLNFNPTTNPDFYFTVLKANSGDVEAAQKLGEQISIYIPLMAKDPSMSLGESILTPGGISVGNEPADDLMNEVGGFIPWILLMGGIGKARQRLIDKGKPSEGGQVEQVDGEAGTVRTPTGTKESILPEIKQQFELLKETKSPVTAPRLEQGFVDILKSELESAKTPRKIRAKSLTSKQQSAILRQYQKNIAGEVQAKVIAQKAQADMESQFREGIFPEREAIQLQPSPIPESPITGKRKLLKGMPERKLLKPAPKETTLPPELQEIIPGFKPTKGKMEVELREGEPGKFKVGDVLKEENARIAAGKRYYQVSKANQVTDMQGNIDPINTARGLGKGEATVEIDVKTGKGRIIARGEGAKDIPVVKAAEKAYKTSKIKEVIKPKVKKKVSRKSLVNRIFEEHKKNDGATFTIEGENRVGQDRFAVGVFKGRGVEIKGRVTAKEISNFILNNEKQLKDVENSIGTYYDAKADTTYLDIVRTPKLLEEAMKLARKNAQDSIYDLKAGEVIDAPKGEVFKGYHVSRDPIKGDLLEGKRRGEAGIGEKEELARLQEEGGAIGGVYLYRKGVKPEAELAHRRNRGEVEIEDLALAELETNVLAERIMLKAVREGKNQREAFNEMERTLKRAGYDGYYSKKYQVGSVFIFGNVKVKPKVKPAAKMREVISKTISEKVKVTTTLRDPKTGKVTKRVQFPSERSGSPEKGSVLFDVLKNPLKPVLELYTEKIGEPAANKAAAILYKLTPEFLRRALIPGYGQPSAYKLLAAAGKLRRERAAVTAQEIGTGLAKGLTQKEQQVLGRYLEGKLTQKELDTLRNNPNMFEAVEAAKQARLELDSLGGQAVVQGLLENEVFVRNQGQYLPRLYRKYELDYEKILAKYGLKKPTRLDMQRFRARKDIPEEVRVLMGEIKEPAYPVAKGIIQLTHDIETAKLFNAIDKNPEWSSTTEKAGFVQMPTTPRLGKLSGKWVTKGIADDINMLFDVPKEAVRFSRAIASEWKVFKVVFSIATHARNLFSNTILAYMNGLPPTRVDIYARAIYGMTKKTPEFRKAMKDGLFAHDFSQQEMDFLLDSWNMSKGTLTERFMAIRERFVEKHPDRFIKTLEDIRPSKSKLGQKAVRLYHMEEVAFKFAKYLHNREKGMKHMESVKEADAAILNYSEVTPFINWARRSFLSPVSWFITFPYKAIPNIASSAIKYPWRIGTILYLLNSIQKNSMDKLGVTEEQQNKMLPKKMKGKSLGVPNFLLLPWRDKHDRLLYWDLTFTLPWGDIGESGQGGWPAIIGGSPVLRLTAEMLANKSLFTNRPIFKETDTGLEKAGKLGKHLYRGIAPTLAPGGYGYENLRRAFMGEKDYFGQEYDVGLSVLANVFGIKTIAIDPEQSTYFRQKEIQGLLEELSKQMYSTINNQGISQREKEERIAEIDRKAEEILTEMNPGE